MLAFICQIVSSTQASCSNIQRGDWESKLLGWVSGGKKNNKKNKHGGLDLSTANNVSEYLVEGTRLSPTSGCKQCEMDKMVGFTLMFKNERRYFPGSSRCRQSFTTKA